MITLPYTISSSLSGALAGNTHFICYNYAGELQTKKEELPGQNDLQDDEASKGSPVDEGSLILLTDVNSPVPEEHLSPKKGPDDLVSDPTQAVHQPCGM